MLTTYDYITMHNQPKKQFPETEHEYFMRMIREMKEARAIEKREARKQKIKAVLIAAKNLFKAVDRPVNLDSVYGR